ncbi:glycosyltransferase [bacterium]|nr:glycosyltransferase [bacterium]MBQ8460757.1 glycosyltransferase [bacterium]MBR1425082.1 glycosyltransferase [bacterium]
MTKISIIIPVYNMEEYLEYCLDSIVGQSLQDIEIICINDGSDDNSAQILEHYAATDERFVIINQENQGQGIARNKGLEVANGEYVMFVDPDDWVEKESLEYLYNFCKNNNADVAQFNFSDYNEATGEFKKVDFVKKLLAKCNYNLEGKNYFCWKDLGKKFLTTCDMHVWTYIVKLDFIKKYDIKFAPNTIAEDHVFSINMILSAERIYFADKYFYNYRMRKNSAVEVVSNDNFCIFDNIKLVQKIIKNKNLERDLCWEFDNWQISLMAARYERIPQDQIKTYEKLCSELLTKKDYRKFILKANRVNNFWQWIFSIKNYRKNGQKYKVLILFGKPILL